MSDPRIATLREALFDLPPEHYPPGACESLDAALDSLEAELAELGGLVVGWRNRAWKAAAELAALREALAKPVMIARLFHETYERLAPSYGYKTREESAVPWKLVPEPNRDLMIEVATEVGAALARAAQPDGGQDG